MGREEFRPKASIVVPVYNAEATLETCIDSLLHLEYPRDRHELILVDNASTDRSWKILQRFGNHIRALQEPKPGPSAARNCGIRNAQFPVVAFTDSDCRVDAQWLRHVVEPLCDPAVGVSGGSIRSDRPCNRVEAFGDIVHDNSKAITHYVPPYSASANWASRREDLLRLNGFDEAFLRSEDVELSCRMLQAGFRLAHAPEAIVYHRNRRTYAGLFREGFIHGNHSVELLERHKQFYQGFGYQPRRFALYRQLWDDLRKFVAGVEPETSGCSLVFNTGKRVGKLAGSLRCGAIHL